MRIFKNKIFHRWSTEQRLTDDVLREAVDEMQQEPTEAAHAVF